MGNYAAQTDIERLLNLSFDETTKVTAAEVEDFIVEREGLIDGVLRAQGYETVPATGASDVVKLRGLVSKVVAADVYQSWYVRDKLPERVSNWRKDFETFLNMLRQGQIHLIDQAPAGEDDPFFMIVRSPQREDYFTERYDTTDWDE